MPPQRPPASGRIFIVDDDVGLLRLVEKALRRAGYTTATAASGREAIKWLSQNRADLMLLDLKLQDIEGKEIISHLADIKRSLPFIIITGQGDERAAVEMMKRGALDYIVKDVNFLPFMPEVVQRSLEHLEQEKQLAAAIAERNELEKALLEVTEREQTRIGQDLHDGLGQHLAGIELMSQVLEQNLTAKKLKAEAARAGDIARHVRDAISQTRLLARGLSPFVLESEGLVSALHELANRTETLFGIACDVQVPATLVDPAIANHLYRITQEAISNAIKHGKTKHVNIKLEASPDQLVLAVQDDGSGIPDILPSERGIGLRIMRYRAAMIHGSLTVNRSPKGGTTVLCSVPLARQRT